MITDGERSGVWVWEATDPKRSGGAGDLAKLFKNEEVEQPGVLAGGAPSAEATLMAREVIQNSWDAAAELKKRRKAAGLAEPGFGISFDFMEVVGPARSDFVASSDLLGLKSQLESVRSTEGERALGMPRTAALDHAHDTEQVLQVLRIVESGTTGMYGPFDGAKSKMFLALISLGYTVKDAGAGGSYGYGKAGLIAGSATRTIFAYSCFEPRPDDVVDGVPVTRRLLGMTYWGQHGVGDTNFTGFARLGSDMGDWTAPLTNEVADHLASRLGIEIRSADRDEQLGTTFVLIDPVVDPQDLVEAIERNWWPAIKEGRFIPMVTDQREGSSRKRLPPRPLSNPILAPFVRAYELATVPQDNNVAHEFRADLGVLPSALDGLAVGSIGIVADLDGWSYAVDNEDPDDESTVRNSSLIALTRGPLMVVEYLEPWGMKTSPPFVRGVFVADEDVDDLLRQTEPKAHDAWVTNESRLEDGVDHKAPKVAKHVLKEIGKAARRFQQSLRPPLPPPEDVRLSALAKLFKSVARGGGPTPPPPPPEGDRFVSIRTSSHIVPVDGSGAIRAEGKVTLSLSEAYKEAHKDSKGVSSSSRARARVRISYKFVEDGKAGESVPLSLTSSMITDGPNEDGYYDVELTTDYQKVDFESVAYSADWSGRLVVNVVVVQPLFDGVSS
jgi:hypothetical protein